MSRSTIKGVTIVINADTTGLADAFKKVRADITNTTGSIKEIESLLAKQNIFKDWTSSTMLLQQEQKALQDEVTLTKQKIDIEEEALRKLGEEDQTPEVIAAQERLQRELIKDKQHLQEAEDELKDFGSVGKQQALMVAEEFQNVGKKISSFGQDLESTGRKLTQKVTTPIVRLGQDVLELSVDFESAMAKVQSVSLDATEQEMETLSNKALELSGTSKYAASEVADAMYYMGLAGWNVSEILSGLPAVLDLAAAGDMDLAQASDIVTDYVTAFRLEAEDATHVADVMAQTMANSNTTVDLMGQSFKYVAPVAGALGYSIEDVSLALGLMANNGIKGSTAGTSLRQFMQRMAKPTKEVETAMEELGLALEDETGHAYSFREILDKLRKSMNDAGVPLDDLTGQIAELDAALEEGEITEEEYEEALQDVMDALDGTTGAEKAKAAAILAGTRGMSGLLAIVNATAEDYEGLADKINNAAGASENIAGVMMDTTEGSMLKLKHSVEELGISFGNELIPYVQDVIDEVGKYIDKFKSADEGTQDLIIKVAAIAAATGPALIAIGSLVESIGSIITVVGALGSFVIANPVFAGIALAVGGVTAAIIALEAEYNNHYAYLYELDEAEQALVESINAEKEALEARNEARGREVEQIDNETGKEYELWEQLKDLVDAHGEIKKGYEARVEYITKELSEATGLEITLIDGQIQEYGYLKYAIEDVIATKRREAIVNAYQDDYNNALLNVNDAQHKMLLAEDALKGKQEELSEAQDYYNEILELNQEYSGLYIDELRDAEAAVDGLQSQVDDLTVAYEEARGVYSGYMSTMQNYEGVLSAIASGDVAEMDVAIQKLTDGFVTSTVATKEELEAQVSNYQEQYALMKQAVEEGNTAITDAQLKTMEQLVADSEAELEKWTDKFYEAGQDNARMFGDGLLEYGEYISQSGYDIGRKAAEALASADAEQIGKDFSAGFAKGIGSSTSVAKIQNASAGIARQALNQISYTLDVGSPSKEAAKIGEFFTQGFAIGIEDEAEKAISAADDLARLSMDALNPTGAYSGTTNNNTYGAINVTINGANVQNDAELAQMVADEINREVLRRQAVYA